MNRFSPVLIPTLNRFDHFKKCVDSLSKCIHSENTDLYIALDYPLKDAHWEGYKQIEAFIPTIKAFKTVNVIKREENYGGLKNFIEANKIVFEKYDRLIFSEDDNEFSPNFLDYINKGLNKFELDPNVFAICGYNYPLQMPKSYKSNFYYYQTFSAWGFGIWKNKFKTFYYSSEDLAAFMRNFNYARGIYKIAEQKPLSILENIKSGLPLYGDGVISLENIKNKMYCIFPTVTKVKNHGHDGSGIHCGKIDDDKFANQIIDTSKHFDYDENFSLIDLKIVKSMNQYFKLPFKGKIKLVFLYLLLKLNLLNKTKVS